MENNIVHGYKVFNSDWTCRGKAYTCPGKFEEEINPSVCNQGMHFCKKAANCFNYYRFDPKNKIAEVIAYGTVTEEEDKCCTDKLEIVREILWAELLEIANTGERCTGLRNSGNGNSGNGNSGNQNSGDGNSGKQNSGDGNSGEQNSGDDNSGDGNSGNQNSGNGNSGDQNSGNGNSGNSNSGNHNSGDWNSGDWNSGNWNSGDWNECNFSNGCFNTLEPKIYLFNKPSEWTYRDWLNSEACCLLNQIRGNLLEYIWFSDMTEEEKLSHPEAETTDGYLKALDESERAAIWWSGLSKDEKEIIMSIPNFDKEIFEEITGIDIEVEE